MCLSAPMVIASCRKCPDFPLLPGCQRHDLRFFSIYLTEMSKVGSSIMSSGDGTRDGREIVAFELRRRGYFDEVGPWRAPPHAEFWFHLRIESEMHVILRFCDSAIARFQIRMPAKRVAVLNPKRVPCAQRSLSSTRSPKFASFPPIVTSRRESPKASQKTQLQRQTACSTASTKMESRLRIPLRIGHLPLVPRRRANPCRMTLNGLLSLQRSRASASPRHQLTPTEELATAPHGSIPPPQVFRILDYRYISRRLDSSR